MKDERCSRCDHCNQSNYVADRLDIWKSALATLKNEEWPDEEHIAAIDVLHLAKFLAGDSED